MRLPYMLSGINKQSGGAPGSATAEFSQNNYLSHAQTVDTFVNVMAFSAWIYLDSLSNNNYIFSCSNGVATDPRMAFRVGTSGELILANNNTGAEWAFFTTANGVISTGQWHHVMFSYYTVDTTQRYQIQVDGKAIDLPTYGTQLSMTGCLGRNGFDIGVGCYIYDPDNADHTFDGKISNAIFGTTTNNGFADDKSVTQPELFYNFNSDGTVSPIQEFIKPKTFFFTQESNAFFHIIESTDIELDQGDNGINFVETGTVTAGTDSVSVTPTCPVLVSHGTASSGTVSLPDVQSGDLIVAFFGADSEEITTPSGWTQQFDYRSSFTLSVNVSTKTAVGGDTIDISDFSSDNACILNWFVIRNANSVSYLDSSLNSSGDPVPPALPTMTAANNGEIVLLLGFLDDDIATLTKGPSTYQALDFDTYGSSGNGGSIMSAYSHYMDGGIDITPSLFDTNGDDYNIGITMIID